MMFQARYSFSYKDRRVHAPIIALFLSLACTAAYAADTLKEDVKQTGHAVGTALHDAGTETKQAAKKVGREVKHAAVATGHAVRDGAKELKNAVKGPKDRDSTEINK